MKKLAKDLKEEIDNKIQSHKAEILESEDALQKKMKKLNLLGKELNQKKDLDFAEKILLEVKEFEKALKNH